MLFMFIFLHHQQEYRQMIKILLFVLKIDIQELEVLKDRVFHDI